MFSGRRSPAGRLVLVAALVAIGAGLGMKWKFGRRSKPAGQLAARYRRAQKPAKANAPPPQALWTHLATLVRIVIPGVATKEFGLVVLHTFFLVGRTGLSIWVAKLDGIIGMAIVDLDPSAFSRNMLKWLAVAIPATFTNAMLRYLEGLMALAFRKRLVALAHEKYMSNDVYYQVVHRDTRLPNPDLTMTEDIANFCNGLAHLYANLSKPVFDVLILTVELLAMVVSRSGASRVWDPLTTGAACLVLTGIALKALSPDFGALVAERTACDGALRFVHSRIMNYSEEIAFYKGHLTELLHLEETFEALQAQITLYLTESMWYTMVQQLLTKYLWSMCGFIVIASVLFSQEYHDREKGQAGGVAQGRRGTRAADMMTSRSLLRSLADACERIMSSGKDVAELAGYAAQLTNLLQVFEDVQHGRYMTETLEPDDSFDQCLSLSFTRDLTLGPVMNVSDTVQFIKLEDVSLSTPGGQCLVRHLSLEVHPGQHLLITGPNGCGKSSLFRLLCELWPASSGCITKPSTKHLFYIPQRPYLPLGTLRDQVIYPESEEQMLSRGRTNDDLQRLLRWVSLEHLLLREEEAGWLAVHDWQEVLSGGEKQRLGFARLMYHRPMFALLDESTSGVSPDIEAQMYERCHSLNITMLSIAHRPSLLRFHTQLLNFDGHRGCHVMPLNAKARPGTGVVHLFPGPAVLWQLGGVVVALNAPAEALFHVTGEEVCGQPMALLFPGQEKTLKRAVNPYVLTTETLRHRAVPGGVRMTSSALDAAHLLSTFQQLPDPTRKPLGPPTSPPAPGDISGLDGP